MNLFEINVIYDAYGIKESILIGTTLTRVQLDQFLDSFYESLKLPTYSKKNIKKLVSAFNLVKDTFNYTDNEIRLFTPTVINHFI